MARANSVSDVTNKMAVISMNQPPPLTEETPEIPEFQRQIIKRKEMRKHMEFGSLPYIIEKSRRKHIGKMIALFE